MEIKAKRVLEELKQAGFYETRIRGDHHRLEDGKGHKVTVNYAKLGDTIRPGTYNSILQQAGLK